MEKNMEIRIPELGTGRTVSIKEIFVKAGDVIKKGKSVARLNMGDELMDVFSPAPGQVKAIDLSKDQTVTGSELLLTLDTAVSSNVQKPASKPVSPRPVKLAQPAGDSQVDLVVIGGGPGGYTAAFRGADLGLKTVLIDNRANLGGVCLNEGCIPSKVLLHIAKIIEDSIEARKFGVMVGPIKLDLERMREWKKKVVAQLTGGLANLARSRQVEIIRGTARFSNPHTITVEHEGISRTVSFDKAIIATGSAPVRIPGFSDNDRIVHSSDMLDLKEIPDRMLIIGGGVIGLEMATVYHALGTQITVVEATDQLLPPVDSDLVKAFLQWNQNRHYRIYTNTRVSRLESRSSGILASFETKEPIEPAEFDRVLVAVGRMPNTANLGLETIGITPDKHHFIPVNRQQKTDVGHIFAIGDITPGPMLAHKATYEGRVAAEVAAGLKSAFEATVIPAVAYTDPEIAWAGVSESEAIRQGIEYEKSVFPWSANGRSLTLGRQEGKTKLIFEKQSHRIIGAGIVGPNASELIAEIGLAIEMGAEAQDLSLTVHPHPTISETVTMAAALFEGTITDLYVPRKKVRAN